ncbi:auxin-responsive protein SAUR40-like [Prosopis cineraria]|uniref:auxin-responsive protein SAUR40-like n=1 Tax=Prosopis cineraria TaxID=364024 RepID=UPI00240FB5B2|nr:auxin-responsive protein SAUR40-like [Prosopis cineraria]
MLGSFAGNIQKGLSLFTSRRSTLSYSSEDQLEAATIVPDDVKEGHFVVLATMGEETRRFIVGLEYLTDPAFMGLLDRAGEEYGFSQKGALAVPCLPQELQKILDSGKAEY